jgi:hypothetical protein
MSVTVDEKVYLQIAQLQGLLLLLSKVICFVRRVKLTLGHNNLCYFFTGTQPFLVIYIKIVHEIILSFILNIFQNIKIHAEIAAEITLNIIH